jgi:Flp pilus assembly pilin Flp
MVRPSILQDTRGANLVEYILLVGVIALIAVGGFRVFGNTVDAKVQEQADCVASLESCGGSGSGTAALAAGGWNSSSSKSAALGSSSAAMSANGAVANGAFANGAVANNFAPAVFAGGSAAGSGSFGANAAGGGSLSKAFGGSGSVSGDMDPGTRDIVDQYISDASLQEFLDYRNSDERDPRLDYSTDECSAPVLGNSPFNFKDACLRHDFGYRNYKKLGVFKEMKSTVDKRFLQDMKDHCAEQSVWKRPACYGMAYTYYNAVKAFG